MNPSHYRQSYSPPDWQAAAAAEAAGDWLRDPEEADRQHRARRRSLSCRDRLCGADDCDRCHPRASVPRQPEA